MEDEIKREPSKICDEEKSLLSAEGSSQNIVEKEECDENENGVAEQASFSLSRTLNSVSVTESYFQNAYFWLSIHFF